MASTAETDLVEVVVTTHLGAKYVFPDMPRGTLENLIRLSGWDKTGKIVLVNVSAAVLTMDARIVKSVVYDGEVKWPVSPA